VPPAGVVGHSGIGYDLFVLLPMLAELVKAVRGGGTLSSALSVPVDRGGVYLAGTQSLAGSRIAAAIFSAIVRTSSRLVSKPARSGSMPLYSATSWNVTPCSTGIRVSLCRSAPSSLSVQNRPVRYAGVRSAMPHRAARNPRSIWSAWLFPGWMATASNHTVGT
jgi:hypothetical protein